MKASLRRALQEQRRGPRLSDELRQQLLDLEVGAVTFDAPVAPWTAFRTGGTAEALVETRDGPCWSRLLAWCRKHRMPVLTLGGGHGVVIREGGLSGLAVRGVHPGGIRRTDEDGVGTTARVLADACTGLNRLAAFAHREGLCGLEPLRGQPGTVGGLLRRHWGRCRGSVVSVATTGGRGEVTVRTVDEIQNQGVQFDVPLRTAIVWCVFSLEKGNEPLFEPVDDPPPAAEGGRAVDGRIRLFEDPDELTASEILKGLDLRAIRLRSVVIDGDDPNVAINRGNGTTRDLLSLTKYLKEKASSDANVEFKEVFRVTGNK